MSSNKIISYPSINNINEINAYVEFKLLNNKVAKHYQEIVYKYLSPCTPYNKLLLYHSTGVGKTFTILWTIYLFRNIFNKAIILVPNDTIIKEYYNKITIWYKYNFNSNDKSKIDKFISNYIIFNKYSKFVKLNKNNQISNRIIIIDEIHNFRVSFKNKKKKKFKLILDIINNATNIKLMLLSATPIYDNSDEVNYILKLFNITSLKEITPYVSFYNKLEFKVPVNFHYLRLDMKKDQNEFYLRNYKSSDFIGINNVINNVKNGLGIIYENDKILSPNNHLNLYNFSNPYEIKFMNNAIQLTMIDKVLNNLDEISIKIYTLVDYIKKSNGLIFVYCNLLEWTGIYYIITIFNILGFVYINEKSEALNIPNKIKYTFVTGNPSLSPNNIDKINLFNSPENIYGDYVKVLIGSKVISESIDLFNVQQIHILTPEWNYEHINQIIGRANRINSHKLLKKEEQLINVYFYLSYPSDKNLSQDDSIINICDNKQISIDKYINEIKNNNIESLINKETENKEISIYSLFYNDFTLNNDYEKVDDNYIPNINYSFCNNYVYKSHFDNHEKNLLIDIDEYWMPTDIYNPEETSVNVYYTSEIINYYNTLNNMFIKYKNNLVHQFKFINNISQINRAKLLEYALFINRDDPESNSICKYFSIYWIKHNDKIIHACYSVIQPTSYGMKINKKIDDFSNIRILKPNNCCWKKKKSDKYCSLLFNHYNKNKDERINNRCIFPFIFSIESIIRIQNINELFLYDSISNKNKINRGRRIKNYHDKNNKLNDIIFSLCIENIEPLLNNKYFESSYNIYISINNMLNNDLYKNKINVIKNLESFKHPKLKNLKDFCIKYPNQAKLFELIISNYFKNDKKLISFWNNIILENNLLVIL